MLDTLAMLLSVLGLAGGVDLLTAGAALAITIAMLSAAVVLLAVVATRQTRPGGASPPHPRRAIDVSSLLTQSDPDAPGHPRPRAPQAAVSAA